MAVAKRAKRKIAGRPHARRNTTNTKRNLPQNLAAVNTNRARRASAKQGLVRDESKKGAGDSEDHSTDDANSASTEDSEEELEDAEEYHDNTIHPSTLQYLEDLAKNNDRDWFHGNKEIYKIALDDFKSFSAILQERLTDVDWTVPILPLERHNLFRIHRDIRFSSSKIPYKEYFSVAFSRTGKKGLYAKYYLSIQPGNQSFIGGGLWHPEATQVSLMRRAIDQSPRGLKDVLISQDFYANFLNPGDGTKRLSAKLLERQALMSFLDRNSEDALKTAPKGYDKEHPDIDLLRLKSYTVGKRLSDSEILLPNSMDYIVDVLRVLEPFVTYLNSVVMPDIGSSQPSNST